MIFKVCQQQHFKKSAVAGLTELTTSTKRGGRGNRSPFDLYLGFLLIKKICCTQAGRQGFNPQDERYYVSLPQRDSQQLSGKSEEMNNSPPRKLYESKFQAAWKNSCFLLSEALVLASLPILVSMRQVTRSLKSSQVIINLAVTQEKVCIYEKRRKA